MIILTDVHGCFRTMKALLDKCPKGEQVCINGDLVDRGPNSAELVEYAIQNNFLCIRGNHEDLMINAYDPEGDQDAQMLWDMNGGTQTMYSYTYMPEGTVERHLEWMRKLPYYRMFPEVNADGRALLVSHAGIYEDGLEPDFNKDLKKAVDSKDIMWHRDPIRDYPGIFQVIGHTPQPYGATVEKHTANIDSGAVFNRDPYGIMTAMLWPSMELIVQRNIE